MTTFEVHKKGDNTCSHQMVGANGDNTTTSVLQTRSEEVDKLATAHFDIEIASSVDPDCEKHRFMMVKLVPKKKEANEKTEANTGKTMNFTFCIDRSGSMSYGSSPRLKRVKAVVNQFLDRAKGWLEFNKSNKINMSVVTYQSYPEVVLPAQALTIDNIATVREKINAIYPSGGTKIIAGLKAASKQMKAMAKMHVTAVNSFVFLTDGEDNRVSSVRLVPFHQQIKEYNVNFYALGISKNHDHGVMQCVTMDAEKGGLEQLPTALYEWIDDVDVDEAQLVRGQTTLSSAINKMFRLAEAQCALRIKCKLITSSGNVESAVLTPDKDGFFSLGALFYETVSKSVFTVEDQKIRLELTYEADGQEYKFKHTLDLQDKGKNEEVLEKAMSYEVGNFLNRLGDIEDNDQKKAAIDVLMDRIKRILDREESAVRKELLLALKLQKVAIDKQGRYDATSATTMFSSVASPTVGNCMVSASFLGDSGQSGL
uniref:von Willebrand factor type A n=1 Tax=uncultured bacterium W5-77b TaxID=1131000 RepID=H9BWE9_9BACT|nr:von Willebrand factor type A [uncultured bacterium W5-77b]